MTTATGQFSNDLDRFLVERFSLSGPLLATQQQPIQKKLQDLVKIINDRQTFSQQQKKTNQRLQKLKQIPNIDKSLSNLNLFSYLAQIDKLRIMSDILLQVGSKKPTGFTSFISSRTTTLIDRYWFFYAIMIYMTCWEMFSVYALPTPPYYVPIVTEKLIEKALNNNEQLNLSIEIIPHNTEELFLLSQRVASVRGLPHEEMDLKALILSITKNLFPSAPTTVSDENTSDVLELFKLLCEVRAELTSVTILQLKLLLQIESNKDNLTLLIRKIFRNNVFDNIILSSWEARAFARSCWYYTILLTIYGRRNLSSTQVGDKNDEAIYIELVEPFFLNRTLETMDFMKAFKSVSLISFKTSPLPSTIKTTKRNQTTFSLFQNDSSMINYKVDLAIFQVNRYLVKRDVLGPLKIEYPLLLEVIVTRNDAPPFYAYVQIALASPCLGPPSLYLGVLPCTTAQSLENKKPRDKVAFAKEEVRGFMIGLSDPIVHQQQDESPTFYMNIFSFLYYALPVVLREVDLSSLFYSFLLLLVYGEDYRDMNINSNLVYRPPKELSVPKPVHRYFVRLIKRLQKEIFGKVMSVQSAVTALPVKQQGASSSSRTQGVDESLQIPEDQKDADAVTVLTQLKKFSLGNTSLASLLSLAKAVYNVRTKEKAMEDLISHGMPFLDWRDFAFIERPVVDWLAGFYSMLPGIIKFILEDAFLSRRPSPSSQKPKVVRRTFFSFSKEKIKQTVVISKVGIIRPTAQGSGVSAKRFDLGKRLVNYRIRDSTDENKQEKLYSIEAIDLLINDRSHFLLTYGINYENLMISVYMTNEDSCYQRAIKEIQECGLPKNAFCLPPLPLFAGGNVKFRSIPVKEITMNEVILAAPQKLISLMSKELVQSYRNKGKTKQQKRTALQLTKLSEASGGTEVFNSFLRTLLLYIFQQLDFFIGLGLRYLYAPQKNLQVGLNQTMQNKQVSFLGKISKGISSFLNIDNTQATFITLLLHVLGLEKLIFTLLQIFTVLFITKESS